MNRFLILLSAVLLSAACARTSADAVDFDLDAFCQDSCMTANPSVMEKVAQLKTVFEYTIPGTITESNSWNEDLCRSLSNLRDRHKALREGSFSILEDQWVPDDVVAYTLTYGRRQVLVMLNFCDRFHTCALPDKVVWKDAFTAEVYSDELVCPVIDPWGWRVLIRK